MELNVKQAVAAIASVLPKQRPIGHHEACAVGQEETYVVDIIRKGIVCHDYIQRFEDKLREVTGVEQAIVVSNGTSALHLALMAVGVKPGDEVLVPTLTYAATANAVIHAGAIPNFVDGILCVNPYKLRCYLARETVRSDVMGQRLNKTTLRPVTALIMVHLMGEPCDWQSLRQVADDFGLKLVEDAAEALGTTSDNTACGNMGDVSILSFNHNKTITTGGGGAVLSNDPFIIAKAYQLAHQGRTNHPWLIEHDTIGWNYAMPPICAAVGLAQIEKLNDIVAGKRKLNDRYFESLSDIPGLQVYVPLVGGNCWMTMVQVDEPDDRDRLLDGLHEQGIHARALFTPLHTQKIYENYPRDNNLEYANYTATRTVCLPSGVGLL